MSIHQESLIAALPQQVFELLTSGTLFSAATGMPAELTDREGGAFSVFGGRVEGRQIELVPGQRVVQAWRFGTAHPSVWEPGVYSTVRFALEPAGDGTRLVIDHTGIPAEWIEHISQGYPTFYQDPITKFFANSPVSLGTDGGVQRARLRGSGFFRPSKDVRYRHIGGLFSDTVEWQVDSGSLAPCRSPLSAIASWTIRMARSRISAG
jgi:uncharacterized protein YndB with AHSA1/START domain